KAIADVRIKAGKIVVAGSRQLLDRGRPGVAGRSLKNTGPLAGPEIAAVGVEYLPDHVARILAREEQEGRRNLVGLAGSADRRILAEVLELFGRLPAERIE